MHGFGGYNYDFSFQLMWTGVGKEFILANDFGGGWWVGYDAGADRVLIVKEREDAVTWTIDPMPEPQYITEPCNAKYKCQKSY